MEEGLYASCAVLSLALIFGSPSLKRTRRATALGTVYDAYVYPEAVSRAQSFCKNEILRPRTARMLLCLFMG